MIPLLRASAQSSLAGSTTPENVVIWLKNKTRVRAVIASLNEIQYLRGIFYRPWQRDLLYHDSVALRA